jgi:hypothetical protein
MAAAKTAEMQGMNGEKAGENRPPQQQFRDSTRNRDPKRIVGHPEVCQEKDVKPMRALSWRCP